jgi:hypothetical protein
MHIGDPLFNTLAFSALILVVAVFFGMRADRKPRDKHVLYSRPSRARRRSVEFKPQARVRVPAAGGR